MRSRHLLRHFARWQFSLGSKPAGLGTAQLRRHAEQALLKASRADAMELLIQLGSTPQGLSDAQAEAARRQSGANEVHHEKPLPAWLHLWHCFRNPFNLLLSALALISWLTDGMKGTVVILAMVGISTLLRFVQEARSNQAADRLRAMVSNTATVLRLAATLPGATELEPALAAARRVELPMRELVPGDLVALSAGDMIPADCRVLMTKDLFISQSALTGEALPVEKFARDLAGQAAALERDNLVYMGTNVISGTAVAVVLHTGEQSFFGALAQRVSAVDRGTTAFQAGINRVSWLLIRFMLVMAPLVLLINGFTKGDWWEAALFALSIAVGLTPEMLPMIVTATLAKGAVFMVRRQVIVKRLEAIHHFGAWTCCAPTRPAR